MTSKREVLVKGEQLWLCTMTGQVAGEKKWSESRTHGGSGGGYMHAGSGFVAPTTITTTVSTRHEFWLVAPDGEERSIEIGNSKVSVREGQAVTAIWGARVGKETGPYLLLHNNNAGSESWLIADAKSLLHRMQMSDPVRQWTLVGCGAAFLLFLPFHGPSALLFPLLALIGGYAYGSQQRLIKAREIKQATIEAMRLELQALAQGRPPLAAAGTQGRLQA